MPTVDKTWFQDRIRDKDLSQRRLAKLMDLDPAAMSLMLSGRRKISSEEANTLAFHLGVSVHDVLTHAGIEPHRQNNTDIKGRITANGTVVSSRRKKTESVVEYPNAKAIICEDEESPYYGWTLYYEPRAGVDADTISHLCLISNGGAEYVARVLPGNRRGVYNLRFIDGETKENLHIHCASPVILIKT